MRTRLFFHPPASLTIGFWPTALAAAQQRWLAGDLCRDAAHAGGAEGADQQDGPKRRSRYGADDAGGALSPGACEDVTQPEAAHAAEPRAARRRRDRFLQRQRKLIALLIEYGLFPSAQGERKRLEKLNPYALRAKGLDHALTLHEFGRVLFHLNQRRGLPCGNLRRRIPSQTPRCRA